MNTTELERIASRVAARYVRQDVTPADHHALKVWLVSSYLLRYGLTGNTSLHVTRRENMHRTVEARFDYAKRTEIREAFEKAVTEA